VVGWLDTENRFDGNDCRTDIEGGAFRAGHPVFFKAHELGDGFEKKIFRDFRHAEPLG
jgi:hypothetical protein